MRPVIPNVGRGNAAQLSFLRILPLIFVCVFATPAMADGPLKWQNRGSGDWGGVRSDLADDGVTFLLLNDTHAQYNTTGGVDTGGAAHNRLFAELNFQLGPLLGWEGSEFQVSGAWNEGPNINDDVGAFLGPSTIVREDAVRLYELYWGQNLLDDQVNLKIGRLGLAPFEYGYSVFTYDFMSAGYNSNPGAFFLNQPVTTYAEPIATWGARVLIEPKDQDFNVRLGAYNGSPRDLDRGTANGVDFSFHPDESTFLIGEFAYKLNQDLEDQGLPGNYKIGVMYDTGDFDRLDRPGEEKDGNLGFYVIGDQMLFRETVPALSPDHPANWKGGNRSSHPTDQGLYAWASVVVNPDEDTNIAPYWVSSGLSYKGLIPGRAADRTGIGFYHSFFSSDTDLDDETQLEVYHQFQIRPWLSIAPDIQYFVNPGGSSDTDNALVIGLNLHAEF